jgi:predicted O-methyltransferase YrrM
MIERRSIAKILVPPGVRRLLRGAHRGLTFRRAMRRFLASPEAALRPGSSILADLSYGWGNEGWSAREDFIADSLHHALTTSGPILECGSGLSTILLGAIATQRGLPYWALEHLPQWVARGQRHLERYRLGAVKLCLAPLKDYGDFSWYDAPLASMPGEFSLVICDGPPGGTKGGRYGLLPVLGNRLRPGCIVLLDDASRDQELAVARRWESELSAATEARGATMSHIRMTVTGMRRQEPA